MPPWKKFVGFEGDMGRGIVIARKSRRGSTPTLILPYVTHTNIINLNQGAKPAIRVWENVDGFGAARRRRITDVATMMPEGATTNFAKNSMLHEYSRQAGFNLGDTHMMAMNVGGADAGYGYVTRISDGVKIGLKIGPSRGDLEWTWKYDDSNLAFYRKDNLLYRYNLADQVSTLLATLKKADDVTNFYTAKSEQEGRPSNDFSKWAGIGYYDSGETGPNSDIVVVRLSDGVVLQRRIGYSGPDGKPNNVALSPLGNYVVKCSGNSSGDTELWDAAASGVPLIVKIHSGPTHADVALGDDGVEYYLYDSVSTDMELGARGIRRFNMSTHADTLLLNLQAIGGGGTSVHISGTGSATHPGWVVCECYQESDQAQTLYEREIFLLKITGANAGEIRRIAHHYSSQPKQNFGADYWGEPKVVGGYGNSIYVASNYGSYGLLCNVAVTGSGPTYTCTATLQSGTWPINFVNGEQVVMVDPSDADYFDNWQNVYALGYAFTIVPGTQTSNSVQWVADTSLPLGASHYIDTGNDILTNGGTVWVGNFAPRVETYEIAPQVGASGFYD